MISNESDARFYVAKSTIKGAGKGLFAKIPIAKGDKLEVLGVLVPAKSLADKCTSYADAYKFRIGKYLLIPTGLGGIANHSNTPNAQKITKGSKVYLIALRDINKGEEVLYIYGPYARKRFLGI
jgi:SET domain-containing protein